MRENSPKRLFSTCNYEQNTLLWLHISLTHAWLLQHHRKWKRLYLRRKRMNILIEAGDNIWCLAQSSLHLFWLSTTTLCIEQQPFFQKAAAASSVWDWEVTCFLSLFVKTLLSITCKVPHKSQSTIGPHRVLYPGSFLHVSSEGPENPEAFLKSKPTVIVQEKPQL